MIIPANVSAIKTPRLYLRPVELSDAADIFEYRRRQDVADFLYVPELISTEYDKITNSIQLAENPPQRGPRDRGWNHR